jgi:tetratricopeptide (TPR) repeat protein
VRISRWAGAAGLGALAFGLASPGATAPPERDRGESFWQWLAEPHQREIQLILDKVARNREEASAHRRFTGEHREAAAAIWARALDDALEMLRHARRLDPDHRRVLRTFAEVAAERGRAGEALAALDRFIALERALERVPVAVHELRGRLLAVQARWPEAEDALEAAAGRAGGAATWRLAQVYMERGRLADAIDLLAHSPHRDLPQLRLALAVAYDRDEQVAQATAVAAAVLASQTMVESLSALEDGIDLPQFTPAVDQHYFTALLYQAAGHLSEARGEWIAYARTAPAPRYRRRAEDHIRAIHATLAGETPR